MCTDIEYLPQLMMMKEKDFFLHDEYDRRNSSTPSITSSSSSASTTTITNSKTTTNVSTSTTLTDSSSWLERKLFSHFKRLFRRNSFPSKSILLADHPLSSTTKPIITPTSVEQSKATNNEEDEDQQKEKAKEEEQATENNDYKKLSSLSSSSSPTMPLSSSISITVCEQTQSITNSSNSTDSLYDYDRLLARCLERQQHDRTEMMSRCQIPITIPHAELVVGHSRSILVNWKSYMRLFRALNRDVLLFQQYINQYYACKSSVNQHEQLVFNVRTTKATFDNVLKLFLNEYVTCLACQKAETHLIKSGGLWRIECQLCGSQRSVKRLKWKMS